jgi:hypothetical protein
MKSFDELNQTEKNVQAGKEADEWFKLIQEDNSCFLEVPRLYERLIELCQEKLPKPKEEEKKPEPKMSEQQAIDFEDERLPIGFGKYGGSRVGLVPSEYFARLTDKSTLMEQIQRYVGSDRFKKRLREEE